MFCEMMKNELNVNFQFGVGFSPATFRFRYGKCPEAVIQLDENFVHLTQSFLILICSRPLRLEMLTGKGFLGEMKKMTGPLGSLLFCCWS